MKKIYFNHSDGSASECDINDNIMLSEFLGDNNKDVANCHTSWDWLMRIGDKIRNNSCKVIINGYCIITDNFFVKRFDDIKEGSPSGKYAAYKAFIKYVKLFNEDPSIAAKSRNI
jgi:hypothetical protein